jgi:hypothetical protein
LTTKTASPSSGKSRLQASYRLLNIAWRTIADIKITFSDDIGAIRELLADADKKEPFL